MENIKKTSLDFLNPEEEAKEFEKIFRDVGQFLRDSSNELGKSGLTRGQFFEKYETGKIVTKCSIGNQI